MGQQGEACKRLGDASRNTLSIVHLEAVKNNMPTLGNRVVSIYRTIGGMAAFFASFAAICNGVKFPVQAVVAMVPESAAWVLAGMVFISYIVLLKIASSVPDLEADDPNQEHVELPVVGEIYKAGLYYLLPIIVLVYFLMIEQKSPGLSAFWASALLFAILLTQHPLKAMFRGDCQLGSALKKGTLELNSGLIDGSRNMIGIGLATATAGVIVGTATLKGIGQRADVPPGTAALGTGRKNPTHAQQT